MAVDEHRAVSFAGQGIALGMPASLPVSLWERSHLLPLLTNVPHIVCMQLWRLVVEVGA